jgi:hypothetical protein
MEPVFDQERIEAIAKEDLAKGTKSRHDIFYEKSVRLNKLHVATELRQKNEDREKKNAAPSQPSPAAEKRDTEQSTKREGPEPEMTDRRSAEFAKLFALGKEIRRAGNEVTRPRGREGR